MGTDPLVGQVLVQVLNGLAFSMLLFLVAVGLSIIFGLMDCLNAAHGSYYMLGAYLGLTTVAATGSFWLALVAAPIVIGLGGYLVERTLVGRLYGRGHLDQALVTLGVAYIVADVVRTLWGGDIRAMSPPPQLVGSVSIAGALFPKYRLFVIGMGAALALALWLTLERTRWGAVIRAGVSNREMVRHLGYDIHRVFGVTFAVGSALAALGGVIAGPMLGVYPGMDIEVLVWGLMVVVIGGLGSFSGSFFGSVLMGMADTTGRILLPGAGLFLLFVLMAAVLLYRPGGLFQRRAP